MNGQSWILTIFVLILFALYLPIDSARPAVHSFKTIIDDFIPLWTPFIVIYISYGLYLCLTFIYFVKRSKPQDLNIILLAVSAACLVAYFVYLFFQNSVERPEIVAKNFFDEIYIWGNTQVPPYNAFPSLHVAISTVCALGFWRIKSKFFKIMIVWAILIIISTVLTKQHYFLDVLSGLILGFTSFWVSRNLLLKLPHA